MAATPMLAWFGYPDPPPPYEACAVGRDVAYECPECGQTSVRIQPFVEACGCGASFTSQDCDGALVEARRLAVRRRTREGPRALLECVDTPQSWALRKAAQQAERRGMVGMPYPW